MKKLIFSIMLIWASAGMQAQDIKNLFVYMPDSIMGGVLTQVNRADCFDFLDSKMAAKVTNTFHEESEMLTYSSSYLCMKMSENVTWQMKILPYREGKSVIAVVTTVCAPACDSQIKFYTTEWKALDSKAFITLPSKKDFLTLPDSVTDLSVREAARQADMLLYTIRLDGTDRMTVRFTTPDYMSRDAAEKIKPFVKSEIIYDWKEGKFVPAEAI